MSEPNKDLKEFQKMMNNGKRSILKLQIEYFQLILFHFFYFKMDIFQQMHLASQVISCRDREFAQIISSRLRNVEKFYVENPRSAQILLDNMKTRTQNLQKNINKFKKT